MIDKAEMDAGMFVHYVIRGTANVDSTIAGKRLIAKELWEKYRAQHFLQKPPISDSER